MLDLLEVLIEGQKETFLKTAKTILPHVIGDDLLQPNDFPELEYHPVLRYEEGVLHGMQAAKAAVLAQIAKGDASQRSE